MSSLKEKLGARIQELRKSKGLTQEKLAEMIDIDTPNLSNIERGKKFMTADTLEKIIDALSTTPKELFDFKHIKTDKDLKKAILERIEKLNLKELQYLYKMIDNLQHL